VTGEETVAKVVVNGHVGLELYGTEMWTVGGGRSVEVRLSREVEFTLDAAQDSLPLIRGAATSHMIGAVAASTVRMRFGGGAAASNSAAGVDSGRRRDDDQQRRRVKQYQERGPASTQASSPHLVCAGMSKLGTEYALRTCKIIC